MQILMSVAFILLTLSIPRPDEATMAAGTTPISMFSITLMLFIITAFASATHDIAADGFYMLAPKYVLSACLYLRTRRARSHCRRHRAEDRKHSVVMDHYDAGYSRSVQFGDVLSPLCSP